VLVNVVLVALGQEPQVVSSPQPGAAWAPVGLVQKAQLVTL
jgi:hypothetical protein